jgi:replication factor A1
MTQEETIQQILQQRPEISKNKVLEKLNASREKTGGLIADVTLLRLIAAELGVQLTQENTTCAHKLFISHLVPGLNDVTVTGRVFAILPSKTFGGAKPGRFASVMVMDEDGILRVVLWNEKADLVESGKLKVGCVVCFSHGYTKEDRNGAVELHLSNKSIVEVSHSNGEMKNIGFISKFASKVKDITESQKNVNLAGVIKKVFPSSTFTRQDKTTGNVIRFVLSDDTGEITVVAWNEKAVEMELSLKENMQAQLMNGRLKVGPKGSIEVHVDSATYINILAAPKQYTKLSILEESSGCVNVEGEVASVPVSKEVKTSKGETVKLAVFELKDETGVVRVSAWRNHADAAGSFSMGERIVLENVYVKKSYDEKLELSTWTTTIISSV